MKLKLVVALLATVLSLGAVVPLCAAEDPKQDAHQEDAYGGGDKATPSHAKHIYVDPPAPALGQSYNIPVLRRTMPWPEGTTLAQLAAQAAPPRQALKRGAEEQRALRERVLGAVRTRQAVTNRRRGRQGKRQAPAGQARRGHLDAVQAEPLGHYGEYEHEHYGGPHAHVERSFTGLTAFDDTNPATGGNAFPSTPPDQGLCVGNGFILETVSSVMRVYSDGGRPLTSPLTQNAFGGYPPEYDATTDVYGPLLSDPSCWYDTKSRRWWHVISVYGDDPTGDTTLLTSLDVAVSTSSDPTGAWLHYRVPASNNGAEGTPNLDCGGAACVADYPQMAVWDHALVITLENFDYSKDNYYGPLVYTLDKEALVQGLATATTILINPGDTGNGIGLLDTLIPARQFSACELRNEFIMGTSLARFISNQVDTLQLLRLRGTASLSTANPLVTLEWVEPAVKLPFQYSSFPPDATQRSGDIPLGTSVYQTTSVTRLAAGIGTMNSVAFVDDKLYAAWGTEVQGVAGAAWALVDARHPARALDGSLISMPGGNNLLYPYLAVRAGGEGVMALSVSGPDYYPSPAYALLTRHGVGRVKLIANGVGPLDDFTGYDDAIAKGPPGSARYGDYTAALVDETGAFWLASEWVAQSCSVVDYDVDPTCDGTRNDNTNWATRVSKVVVR